MKKQSSPPKKNFPIIKTIKETTLTQQQQSLPTSMPSSTFSSIQTIQGNSKTKEIPTLAISTNQKLLDKTIQSTLSLPLSPLPREKKYHTTQSLHLENHNSDTPRTKAINAIKSKTMTMNNTNSNSNNNDSQISTLNQKIAQLKLTLEEMEKERDFYFTKLRDIEILTQQVNDNQIIQHSFYKSIMNILYKTEDGFEIPDENFDSAKIILDK